MIQFRHNPWKWIQGQVDTTQDHFKLRYGEDPSAAALVGRGDEYTFIVQFLEDHLGDTKRLKAVTSDLDYMLVELNERDPWLYAQYHCGTAANIYSGVHWGFYPKSAGDQMDLPLES